LGAVETAGALRANSTTRISFNGATAWEPWRPARGGPTRRYTDRFNGATAWEPWRQPTALHAREGHWGFNGATAWEPWRPACSPW